MTEIITYYADYHNKCNDVRMYKMHDVSTR